MSEAIVFISHSRVREGKLEGLREFLAAGSPALEADKPLTLAFLPYLNEDRTEVAIVHAFADAHAFDVHLEGVMERSAAADEFIETIGYEIYGRPNPTVTEMVRAGAARSGVSFRQDPDALSGFLR
jgi:hypothetical protein